MYQRMAISLIAVWLMLMLSPARATVRAEDYDAFWIWSGVKPQPGLARARSLYILQGQVEAGRGGDDDVRLLAQGMAVPRLRHGEVWLVYRAHTLRWSPDIYRIVLAQLQRWRRAGNPVVGIQIDFDAGTRHLPTYADFLRDLRSRLPADCKLSITGLLDWSSRADVATINQLKSVVDEVIVQTYQGRHTIADYAAYLPRVSKLTLPFKIGLVQYGQWQAPDDLANSRWFRGYVVFLQNAPPEH